MHRIFELADIARPAVGCKRSEHALGERRNRAAVAVGIMAQEMVGEQRHVVGPFAKRRNPERRDVEPEHEVGPEAAGADQRGEIGVGRGDDSHVRLERALGTERAVLSLLQEAQHRHLRARSQGVDLVEEQGAALGLGDQPLAVVAGVGEGAPDMAEQLVLEQGVWKRPAIDRHERPACAGAEIVDGAGEQLLAGARLAGDQNRGVELRVAAHQPQGVDEGRRPSHDAKIHEPSSHTRQPPQSPQIPELNTTAVRPISPGPWPIDALESHWAQRRWDNTARPR